MISHGPGLAPRPRPRLRRHPAITALLLGLFLAGVAGLGVGQAAPAPGAPTTAEGHTQALLSSALRYHAAGPAAQAQHLGDLLKAAAARQQFLAALVQTDPGAVLRVAVPAGLRGSLPPAVQAYIEHEVQEDGVLEVLHEDSTTGSRYHYFLDTAAGRLSLHFAADAPALHTGTRVRVHGLRVNSALALQSSSSVQTLSAIAPNTFGQQKVLVMLVNFQDKNSQPYTPSDAQGVVFSTTSNFYYENSYQQDWFTGDVAGWFTIAELSTACNYTNIASQAQQAASAAGFVLSNYNRYIYAFPQNACGWWGLGTVGGNPSQAWINGSLVLQVVAHEVGHNHGLYHSHALECGSVVLGGSCTSIEYGDTLDVMGYSSYHFNAFQKERLGWLNYGTSPAITTATFNSTYTLDPYEPTGSNPKAVKILQATSSSGQKTWFYLEYRRPLGFDSSLSSNSNVLNGIVVRLGTDNSANSSYLLDMTPATSSWSDPALDVGQTYSDPTSGVTISPMWANSTNAGVAVSFGPIACVQANPTVAVSPSQTQYVKPGTTVTYTVTVTNNDNAGCSPSNFTLSATVPSGWAGVFGASPLNIVPGASGSTTLQVTAPATAADGFYTITAGATNTGATQYTASTSVTEAILSSLTVAVSTDKATYSRNQWVTVTASLSADGAPVANATVTFTLTKANNGGTVTGTVMTGATGSAVFKYRLKQKDPTGQYKADGNANLSNTFSGQGSTTFMVQ